MPVTRSVTTFSEKSSLFAQSDVSHDSATCAQEVPKLHDSGEQVSLTGNPIESAKARYWRNIKSLSKKHDMEVPLWYIHKRQDRHNAILYSRALGQSSFMPDSVPPNGYLCRICDVKGHWQNYCPKNAVEWRQRKTLRFSLSAV